MDAVVVRDQIGPDGAVFEHGVPEPKGSHPLSPGQRMLIEVRARPRSAFRTCCRPAGSTSTSPRCPTSAAQRPRASCWRRPWTAASRLATECSGSRARARWPSARCSPPGNVLRLPDHLSFAEGAAVYINYCTAWYALHRAGAHRVGETVLVQGAAGGVGTAVLQVARGVRRARHRCRLQRREGDARARSLGRRRGRAQHGGPVAGARLREPDRGQGRARRRRYGRRRPLHRFGALDADRGAAGRRRLCRRRDPDR